MGISNSGNYDFEDELSPSRGLDKDREGSTRSARVPEKQMIFRLVFNISGFCVAIMLVFGTARPFKLRGGVIAAGILNIFSGGYNYGVCYVERS